MEQPTPEDATVTVVRHRVRYVEADPMGVVYHAHYVVWLDVARTELLRQAGMSYRDFEARGFRLAVSDLAVRYRAPARFDDVVRVECWVRAVESRRVAFGYAIRLDADGTLLATASIRLMVLDDQLRPTRLPADVAPLLVPRPDLVPLD